MTGRSRDESDARERQVERGLLRCAEWSQMGRHRKVLTEVERLLAIADRRPRLRAQLLVWKAQALLAMGRAESALPAATASWELEASAHSCHLMSNALEALGEAEQSEQMLRLGAELFPDAVHLPVQLAVLLTGQGRLPEALDTLEGISLPDSVPEDLQVFLFGLRANLLAAMGRWVEAREHLEVGLRHHPDSSLLADAQDSLEDAWQRVVASEQLRASWEAELTPLEGIADEVDDAVVNSGAALESDPLVVLAARRLWRAFHRATGVQPQTPAPWGLALVATVTDLDGERPSTAALARALRVSASTTRAAIRRLRAFLDGQEPELARRSFAASTNPRLREPLPTQRSPGRGDNVIRFPSRGGG